MKKLWLAVSLLGISLGLCACGGGGSPSAKRLSVTVSGSVSAGTAFSITITALDSAGNVVTSYTGTLLLTSSDAQAVLPASAAITNGTTTVQVTLRTAGSQTISASDMAHAVAGVVSVSVTAGPASQLSVTSIPTSSTAGIAFNVTVTAADAFSNVLTSYAGSVHFTSSDSQATLPTDSKLPNGTAVFSIALKTAGSQTITVTDTVNASVTGTSGGITVNPGPPTRISLSAPPAVTTNLAFMATVSAADNFGNVATSYGGTVKFTSSDAHATLPANSALTSGTGSFSLTLITIGSQTITAADTVQAALQGTSGAINVVSNAATHLSVMGPGSSSTRQTIQLAVNALDAANNVSTGYTGKVRFTSSDGQAKLPADSPLTMGTANFNATLETAGTDTITATDTTKSSITGIASISVTTAAALAIGSGAPPNGTVGQRYNPHLVRFCIPFPPICHFIKVYGFPLAGTGGIAPYRWSWAPASGSSLPAGLNVANANNAGCRTGIIGPACIYGTPTQPGTFQVALTITDSGLPAASTTMNYTITIALPPAPVVNATPAPAPRGENLPYSFTFTASGYPPLTWNESGALPTGLGFDSATGTLSGTPTQTGSFPITMTATDQFNQASVAVNFTVVIATHGFAATGSMGTARRFHSATLLGNGKVLITGGEDAASNAFASAELYDPSTGKFTPTTGSMTVARVGHTATLLNNGNVLITGGATDPSEVASSTAEIYDPTTDKFTATAATMTAARVEHTATLLQSGKVLIAGGDVIFFNGIANSGIHSLGSAEIFDPGTGKFTATAGSMTVPRESHTATLLSSGKVLIAGGSDGTLGNSSPAAITYATSETFDPSTGMFTAAGMMTTQRDYQTANLLSGGKVLVAGGEGNAGTETSADLFDPASGSFAATGHMTEARFYQDASTLADGTVLVTGGSDDSTRAKDSAEVYDPVTATFTGTGSMLYPRVWHTSTVLQNGKVLITGGAGSDSVPVSTAELYQ